MDLTSLAVGAAVVLVLLGIGCAIGWGLRAAEVTLLVSQLTDARDRVALLERTLERERSAGGKVAELLENDKKVADAQARAVGGDPDAAADARRLLLGDASGGAAPGVEAGGPPS